MVRDKSIAVPFVQQIGSTQLEDGKAIGMKGEIEHHTFRSSSFCFALTTGPNVTGSNLSDFAIYVNYREKVGWVINQLVDDKWQTEDRYPVGDGVDVGKEVYVRIAPYKDYFAIFANGEKICERSYVIPLSAVNFVYIDNDIELHRVQFEDNFYMVPFYYDFQSFQTGKSLYVTGKPTADVIDFSFNFRQDDKNIPFQFNPRFKDQVVIRNTMKDGDWGDEERSGGFPFRAEAVFDLIFDITDEGYVVYVNGSKFCTFFHRIPPINVKQLEIVGNVELSSVHF